MPGGIKNITTRFLLFRRPPVGDTRFRDVLFLITATVAVGFLLALVRAFGLWSQIGAYEDQVRQLKEQASAMSQHVADSTNAIARSQAESRVPHPALADRDKNAIGDHTNVSWTFSGRSGPYLSYEIQLGRLSTNGAQKCEGPDLLQGRTGTRFIATDPRNLTSRIPPDDQECLPPGTYAWRVAPVPAGAAVEQDIGKDDPKRLAEWSAYATFTIFPSVLDRIVSTGHVRVGTNLEQNTRFAQRAYDGSVKGFDVSLLHALIEGCLSRENRLLVFKKDACEQYTSQPHSESFPQAGSCDSGGSNTNQLCYDFVPVPRWSDWQSWLRRREIDLFIGGVTAAATREGRGIRFSTRYLQFQSRLYVRPTTDVGVSPTMTSWLTQDRVIGVIAHSSNETLLDAIIATHSSNPRGPHIRKATTIYQTMPALEGAMDRGDIDGVLIDETFLGHEHWTALPDLRTTETRAWQSYASAGYVGESGAEEVAIAVADEGDSQQQEKPGSNNCTKPGSLVALLNCELKNTALQNFIPKLCRKFWSAEATSGYRCRVPRDD